MAELHGVDRLVAFGCPSVAYVKGKAGPWIWVVPVHDNLVQRNKTLELLHTTITTWPYVSATNEIVISAKKKGCLEFLRKKGISKRKKNHK